MGDANQADDDGDRWAATTAGWLATPAVVHVDASPDGCTLAVTSSRVPIGAADEAIELRLVEVANGAQRAPSWALDGDHTATWSPDGSRLAFLTARDGTTQVAIAAPDASSAEVVTALPAGVTGPVSWSPDGRSLVLAARRGRSIDRDRPWRITRAVQWGDGIGALDDPPQLWVHSLDDGTTVMVTDDEWRWSLPRWSPDGRTIAARASFDPTGQRRGQHVRLVGLDGPIDAPPIPGGAAVVHAWATDGSLLVLSFQPEGRPVGSAAQLHRRLGDGECVRLDMAAPAAVGGTVYGDSPAATGDAFESALLVHGTDLYVRTQQGGRMGVARCALTDGRWSEVVAGDRCASPLGVTPEGLLIADQAADRPCRLACVASDGAARPVVPPADDVPAVAEVYRWTVPSPHDGHPLDAWHLRPAGVEGPLPTVLLVHGGPNAAFGECFVLDAQALCAAGFGVVYTNPHGSTGSGDAFTHAAIGHWGDIPVDDVMAVLDDAVARGWADPDRLGVTGNSYGGYLTAWLACTTDRFRAGVAENPVTDLLSMYGTSDIGATFLPMQLGASPLDDVEPYLRWSPLLRANGCHTPLLFVVGTEDRRCPPAQAFELHRTLRALGRVSEVLVLPGASHEGSTFGPPACRLAHDHAVVDWMRRWLLAPS